MSNDEIPRGPEDVPLMNYVKEHYIIVTIVDIKSNRKIRENKVNYSDRNVRIWLGKVTFWATCNGYRVETCADKDHVVE